MSRVIYGWLSNLYLLIHSVPLYEVLQIFNLPFFRNIFLGVVLIYDIRKEDGGGDEKKFDLSRLVLGIQVKV